MVFDSEPYTLVVQGSELKAERERVLELLDRVVNRLRANKWRGVEAELDRYQKDVYFGTQLIDFDPNQTDSSPPTPSAPPEATQ